MVGAPRCGGGALLVSFPLEGWRDDDVTRNLGPGPHPGRCAACPSRPKSAGRLGCFRTGSRVDPASVQGRDAPPPASKPAPRPHPLRRHGRPRAGHPRRERGGRRKAWKDEPCHEEGEDVAAARGHLHPAGRGPAVTAGHPACGSERRTASPRGHPGLDPGSIPPLREPGAALCRRPSYVREKWTTGGRAPCHHDERSGAC